MWEKQLQRAIEAAKLASKEIINVYKTDFEVEIKEDKSPVTLADIKADKVIRDFLLPIFSDYSFLSEESNDDLERICNDFVWIIDPLDGTKEFINHRDEFTINIALSYKHEIVVGVVYLPVTGEYYYASKGNGSFYFDGKKVIRIHVNNKTKNLTFLTSVFHMTEEEQKIINEHKDVIKKVLPVGAAIKPCLIAKGDAEMTYRLSPNTKEWDIAACEIIIKEAGGFLIEPNGQEIKYNRKDVYNRNGYICVNKKENIFR